ncbi:MAG TPA: amidohydrolase family protein [Gaiellaceae bacterium]
MDAGRRELPGGWVAVRDGRVEAVGDGEPPACDQRLDASGCVVCPGLVNAHQHLWYGLFRGLGAGLALEAWLERLLFPLGALVTEADLVLATRLACLEMLSTGTTCAFEHSVTRTTPEIALGVAAAAQESGFRLVVGKELRAGDDLAEAEALVERLPHPGLVVETAAHWLARGTTTDELIAGAHDLAARRGLRISNHAATGAREHYGGRDVEHLHRLGVLDEHWLLVHAIWLSDRDVELVDDTGAWVIDTPTSQAARGGGVTRARDLRRFALGTDGPMVDASVDMLEQAKALLAEQNQAALAPTRIDARAALAAATIDAARAIGLGAEIGSLEPGKRADIAVFDLSAPHVGIAHDPVVSLVTAARGPDVKHVLVDGRPSNGLVLDYGELRDEAAARARELASLAGLR